MLIFPSDNKNTSETCSATPPQTGNQTPPWPGDRYAQSLLPLLEPWSGFTHLRATATLLLFSWFNCFIFIIWFTEINDIPLELIIFFFTTPFFLSRIFPCNSRHRMDNQLNNPLVPWNDLIEWQKAPNPVESRGAWRYWLLGGGLAL